MGRSGFSGIPGAPGPAGVPGVKVHDHYYTLSLCFALLDTLLDTEVQRTHIPCRDVASPRQSYTNV